jgi:hypothetical protein
MRVPGSFGPLAPDVMKRISAHDRRIITSFLLELIVYPPI